MKIKILKDTNIIEDNTADSLAAVLTIETPTAEYTAPDGAVVKGDNLIVSRSSNTTQGDLKNKITSLDSQITSLQTEKAEAEALLASISVEIEKAVAEILDGGGVDNRAK